MAFVVVCVEAALSTPFALDRRLTTEEVLALTSLGHDAGSAAPIGPGRTPSLPTTLEAARRAKLWTDSGTRQAGLLASIAAQLLRLSRVPPTLLACTAVEAARAEVAVRAARPAIDALELLSFSADGRRDDEGFNAAQRAAEALAQRVAELHDAVRRQGPWCQMGSLVVDDSRLRELRQTAQDLLLWSVPGSTTIGLAGPLQEAAEELLQMPRRVREASPLSAAVAVAEAVDAAVSAATRDVEAETLIVELGAAQLKVAMTKFREALRLS